MRRALLIAVAGLACDAPFDDRDHVDRLRVLAVRAEPPEIGPGDSASLDALVVAPDGALDDVRFAWRACVPPWRGDPGGGFDGFAVPGPSLDDAAPDCDDPAAFGVTSLGEAASARFTAPAELDPALTAAYGDTSEEAHAQLARIAGAPWRIELTVRRGDEIERASKIVRVSRRSPPNDNPPPPAFDGEPCVPAAVDRLAVATITASLPATFEPYEVLLPALDGARFEVVERTERWTYAAFATDGDFTPEVVKVVAGDASLTWRRTRAADLWIVLRDGRGGTSWCHRAVPAPP